MLLTSHEAYRSMVFVYFVMFLKRRKNENNQILSFLASFETFTDFGIELNAFKSSQSAFKSNRKLPTFHRIFSSPMFVCLSDTYLSIASLSN